MSVIKTEGLWVRSHDVFLGIRSEHVGQQCPLPINRDALHFAHYSIRFHVVGYDVHNERVLQAGHCIKPSRALGKIRSGTSRANSVDTTYLFSKFLKLVGSRVLLPTLIINIYIHVSYTFTFKLISVLKLNYFFTNIYFTINVALFILRIFALFSL